jgi:hypothetical protein
MPVMEYIQFESYQTSIGHSVLAYLKGVYFSQGAYPCPFSSKLALEGWASIHNKLKIL